MFNKKNNNDIPKDLYKDLSKLLKEEGNFVQELSDVATKAAEFHARLESIEKAIEGNPASYNSNQSDDFVENAKEKYSSELEKRMKEEGSNHLNTF